MVASLNNYHPFSQDIARHPYTCANILPKWAPVDEDMKARRIIGEREHTRGDHVKKKWT